MPRIPALLSASLGLCVLLLSASASADVVQPEPICLMPGKVGVTGHSGPKCVDKAPTNCPPGWRGVVGGECEISPCSMTVPCDNGQICVDTLACFERTYYKMRGGGTREHIEPLGIVGPTAPCDAPRIKANTSVCVPPGETPTAYVTPPGQTGTPGLPRRAGGGCSGSTTGVALGTATATFVLSVGILLLWVARRKAATPAKHD